MATVPGPATSRNYHSPLRATQAAETRLRILNAAATLFSREGFAGTSLADIARAADVSVETVKLGGPKRKLLLAAFEHSFAGSEGVTSLAEHDPVEAITAGINNDAYLAGIIHFVAESNRRSSQLWAALLAAAVSDTTLNEDLQALQTRRRSDLLVLVDELLRRELVPSSTSRDTLADTVSFLLSPEGYIQLVLNSNWSQERYETWLAQMIIRLPATLEQPTR